MSALRRALVVGAGLAGPAVAIGLRARGVEVDLVELREPGAELGAGILLTGNALAALDTLGVGARVRAAGRRVRTVRFADAAARELFALDVARPGWPDFVSIHRAALRAALVEAALPLRARVGVGPAALEDAGEAVLARLSDGSEGRYDLVVGADGLRSRVRELVFGAPAPEAIAGYSGWRFVARCPAALVDPLYLLGDGRTMLLHPLAGGEVYCGAGPVADDVLAAGRDEHARLRATFAGFAGPARAVLDALDAATPLLATRYWQVAQAPWHRGRCVLVGDAAHACAPTLAQGGAMAFEDAVVLCEELARADGIPAALAGYERRRRPRLEAVQRASLARMDANRTGGPGAARPALRDAVLRRFGSAQLAAAWAPLMEPPF